MQYRLGRGSRRFWVCAIAALALAWASTGQAFDLQAHRGGRGLMPENTLAAFERALELGVTTLELDIAITADGVAVISHEPSLSPTTARDAQGRWLNSPGPLIKSLSLAKVQSYDVGRLNPDHPYGKPFAEQQPRDGERIPTLASLFKRVDELGAKDVQFDIETDRRSDTLPPEEFVSILLSVIHEAGMARRVMIQSFDWRTLQLIHNADPAMRAVYLTIQTPRTNNVNDPRWTAGRLLRDYASVAHMIKAAGGTSWAPLSINIDQDAVKRAQQLGLEVIPWTVNEIADMRRLMDWGVEGIITDYPDRLREVMRERGLPLPKGLQKLSCHRFAS